jgi:4-hydroxy-2-oxoheptanedioate aldolase
MTGLNINNVRPNRTKARLAQGHTVYGIAIEYGNVQTVEIAAAAGCDFITFDMEHEASSLSDVLSMARAANVSGITPVVRLGRNHGHYINPLLAAGVQGFIISRIKSAAEITELTNMLYYYPLGKRTAWAHGRTAEFGIETDFDAWCARFNKEIHLHVNVEEKEAVEDLDNILAHPLVDVIDVGTMDLRLSMGLVPYEEIARIEESIFARAVAAGKYVFEVHRGHTLTPRAWKEIRPGHGSIIRGSAASILSTALLGIVAEVKERSRPRA